MNKLSFVALLLLATTAAACAAPTTEEAAGSTTSNIEEGDEGEAADEGSEKDPTAVGSQPGTAESSELTMEVEDLDQDGIPEQLTSRVDLCGTGGCTWTIHLSKLGEAGTVFAQSINVMVHGTADVSTTFFAHQSGGACYHRFVMMRYNGSTYQPLNDGIDCNEVINRPEGAPIAQFEYQCMAVTAPECRGQ